MASTSNLTAQTLMIMGKRYAANYIHRKCSDASSDGACLQYVNELLDILLTPSKAIDDYETIDWCRWLMAGGRTPDEFANAVLKYDSTTICGLVWTPNFVAYRCRTCGISPCMSLCTECFKKGNHEHHDFNMFLSQSGGACDCGDTSVMKESGFCDKHGLNAVVNKSTAPSNLTCVANAIMPRIILRLVQHLRENCKAVVPDYRVAIEDADGYLSMLLELSNMGTLMRRVMTSTLTNKQKYHNLMDPSILTGQSEYDSYCQDSNKVYQDAVKSLPNPEPPDEYRECASLQEHLEHTTFLEELMFWTVVYEFPEKIVCFLLNMLPELDYKEALTRAFVLHYSRISMMLECSTDPEILSNRVVHISVQLFSNKHLALRMVDELKLLHVMIISLKYMMSKVLIQNTLHDPDKNFHYVVDCGRQVMKDHCYWPIVSDLNNVLSHKLVAIHFMSDDTLLEMWFDFLSMFQGMNVNQREVDHHIEFEPNTYYAAFSVELEAAAYPMWALVSHLHGPESAILSRKVLTFCLTALQDWLDAINYTDPNMSDNLKVSFHLPLHRYFAILMCVAVRQQGATLNDLLPPTDMLHLLMMHPLRVQVACYEISNGLWVRNGLQIKGQAMTYIQCNFCNSMVDADMYLLQVCAMKLQPDVFLKTVIEKFHIREWMSLSMYRISQNESLEGEHDNTPMLESCLIFLATLVNIRTNLGLSELEISRLEMVTLLCMGDKTHSQLMELIPERSVSTYSRDFECVLSEVAQYRAQNLEPSGIMQQGMYGPKPHCWEELFDPLHVLLRGAHRRDFQTSMDRFTEYVQHSGKIKNNATPWPPFRHPAPVSAHYDDPRIVLRSKVFHAMIFILLYKATHGHNISEHVMALAIYLLEMAVVTPDIPDKSVNPLCQYTTASTSRVIKDTDLSSWYETDNLSDNLRMMIPQVILVQEPESNNSGEFNWEIETEITEVATSLMLIDGTDEGSLEALALTSTDSIDDDNDNDLSTVMTTTSLPALPSANAEYGMVIVPEDGIVAIPNDNREDDLMPLLRALPPSTEESMALAIESPPSPTNMITGQPALPPAPQRPAVMAGNEIVAAPTVYSRLSTSGITTTEIVPSTSNQPKHLKRREPQVGGAQPQTLTIGESIISLLLKLHSQLSGVPDSYNPDQDAMSDSEASSKSSPTPKESRIGDGPFFISQLLRKIANLDSACRDTIIETKNKLWPRMQEREDEIRERENREREESKRQRARERQQKLMAEFANKQKQFMEKAMETEEAGASGMNWDQEDSTNKITNKKEYHCVICNQTSPSSEDKPMGLVVLTQATSVIGYGRQHTDQVVLPTSDEDPPILKDDTRGAYFDRRIDELYSYFDTFSWLLSINLGWKGGVHVQTCGHHLHLECLELYLQSLSEQRQHSLAVDRKEYFCPLCRQLANSFLPLSPQLGECAAVVQSRHASPLTVLLELSNFLREIERNPLSSTLAMAMGKAMEDMTSYTYLQYKRRHFSSSHESLFLFVTSIARTNFEVELMQRGGSLCSSPANTVCLTPKRNCIVALLHVLAMHARVLAPWPVNNTWQQLSGIPIEYVSPFEITVNEREVPLLLRDPAALLIQFILLLPLHLDQTYFSSVVKVIFNLLYYQVILQISCGLSQVERNMILRRGQFDEQGATSSESIMCRVIEYFNKTNLYCKDDTTSNASTSSSTSYSRVRSHSIEQQIQFLCLPFLRIAALLRYHLYEQPLPAIRTPQTEFVKLVYYLELVRKGMRWVSFNSTVALNWQDVEASMSVPRLWFEQFHDFANRNWAARTFILEQHIPWRIPKLLRLPREYEKIFTYYHERQCQRCNSVPRELSICLVCGTIVCLRQDCCKQIFVCEAVQHSIDCGGGTGIYLVVTSTYIIVIRGRRACLWGSLYLDDFEEEDRDLKRGKPLYLSKARYQLLEQQWLTHRFDHTKKTWVWHRDSL